MSDIELSNLLLVCDMDGTLVDSQKKVSIHNQNALHRFTAQGGRFTLATGRVESSINDYLSVLPINVPAILYNGAVLYDFDKQEAIWNLSLPQDVRSIVREVMGSFPGVGIEIYREGQVHFIRENEETDRHRSLESFNEVFGSLDDVPDSWQKVIFAWEPEQLDAVEKILPRFGDIAFDHVRSESQFLELLPEHVSKGHALQTLTKQLDIPCQHVIAMGDYLNDMEMIQVAGTGIAVDNAHPQLKKAADFTCRNNDHHPVAEVIEWIEKSIGKKSISPHH